MPDQVDWRAMQGEGTPARAVGRLLRDQREELGLALSDVSQRLRIRRPYIEAIEEGRFEELPGAAYIPAFLRAYSVHLGLDPEKVLSAYHSSGALPIERPTALPADFPLVEKRTPYGLAVLTILMVIAAGYAVWRFMPSETPVMAQKVPPVPDRLLAERTPAPNATAATTPAPTQPPVNEARATPPSSAAPQTETKTPPAEMWPLPKSEAVPPPTVAAAPLIVVPQAPPPPPVQIAPPPSSVSTIGQAQAAQPPAPLEPRGEPVRPAPEQEARAVPELPRTEVSLPVARDTPIRLRVDSWLELRAPNGDVLAQTYLRAGESYTIPAGIAYRVINAR